MAIFAAHALLEAGWFAGVRVSVSQGRIEAVEHGVAPAAGDERCAVLLPGMANLHSHAFQRGMAGLTEVRGTSPDSFWTWREAMYRYALAMTPDQLEAIAAQLYVEMLEAGFTRVGEFHYLHHDRDGRPYADIAETASRIVAAAAASGIGLTLLPTFYAHGDFGGAPPSQGQRRFLNDLASFARLVERCRTLASGLDGAVVGIAPHSLRAVTPAELAELQALAPSGPLHIHAAEQLKEVESCLAWSGRRPVEWLLDHAPVDSRWCLIHATHMTDEETRRLAASGAVAGLCPVTEANLGDGIFNGAVYAQSRGQFGVGSDSNVLIGVGDELRQLEVSQRLRDKARNVLATGGGSTGEALYRGAVRGGAQALGLASAGIQAGARADLVSIDVSHAQLAGRTPEQVIDALVFSGADAVDAVWVGGIRRVSGGRHLEREAVGRRFATVMRELQAA
ncbi:MAG: formimidoylglutamate deiminase [Hyphomicrobiaceae bacterium]